MTALTVSALLAWALFAFGGTYLWGAAATAAGAAMLLVVSRRAVRPAPDLRALNVLLLAALAVAAFQTVRLPSAVVGVLSPQREAFAAVTSLEGASGALPLSIAPADSFQALIVFGSAVAVFWSALGVFQFGGIRTVARSVAFLGLAAAVLGILQDASRTRLIYWWWPPLSEGPPGFGPFINRNHYAAWTVMALALSVGYLAARTHARDEMDRFRSFSARLRRRLDLRTVWLLLAIAAMILGAVLSLSRSGMAGGVAAIVAARMVVAVRRHPWRRWSWIGAASVLVLAIVWTGPSALMNRWQAVDIGQEGRSIIWRDTRPIVRDFWLTGTGVGTYGAAMTVYQRSDRDSVHFNQAHNHYLQVLVEGGVLLWALCAAAAFVFVRAARQRLHGDHTGMLWLRVGAAAGLAGLAVSSLWETAARMPANALLAAVAAAIVLHDAHAPRPSTPDHEDR